MCFASCASFAVCLALASAGPVPADDQADLRALLDKAIKARGGEARLNKFKAATWKGKEQEHFGAKPLFTGEWFAQGPEQYRRDWEYPPDGDGLKYLLVVNGGQAWLKYGNDPAQDMGKAFAERAKVSLPYVFWIATLVPLKDKEFQLSPLGEVKINGRPAVGIQASRKGYRDINLFFDKETSLLVKTELRVEPLLAGLEVTEERYFSDYKETNGVRWASKITTKRDGELYTEYEVSEFTPRERLDDSIFAKPR